MIKSIPISLTLSALMCFSCTVQAQNGNSLKSLFDPESANISQDETISGVDFTQSTQEKNKKSKASKTKSFQQRQIIFSSSAEFKASESNIKSDKDGKKHSSKKTVSSNRSSKNSTHRSSEDYCHVGPRGGTYTITASGRKNYRGC